jgi:DNA-binding transcriptional LysR family regulator
MEYGANVIELRHLRYFVAVAEALHFGRAATQLGMAQPPLSQQIKALETIVGHRLFDRTTRGVRLTVVGRYLLDRARIVLSQVEGDLEMARRLGTGQEGALSVGFSGSVMFTRMPFAIERYRGLYPRVELQLQELATAEQMRALRAGALDLAFLRDGEPDDEIQIESLLTERFMAILPKQHPLAVKKTLRPSDLRDEQFVFYARKMGPLAFDRMMACCEDDGFRPTIVQDTPQWPTALRLIAAGLGVTIAPACVASLAMSGVVFRPLRSTRRTFIDIGIRRNCSSPVVDAFLKLIRQQFTMAD